MRNDEVEAFTAHYRVLFAPAAGLARRLTGDAFVAEDLAAEALARAYSRWSHVSRLDSPKAWVLRVTTNLAVDHVRRQQTSRRFAPVLLERPWTGDEAEAVTSRLALVAALAALPQRQREAIALVYLAGLTDQEASSSLGLSASTVRTHLQRGLESLRDSLGVKEVERVALT